MRYRSSRTLVFHNDGDAFVACNFLTKAVFECSPDLLEFLRALASWSELPVADALVLAVAHQDFVARPLPEVLGKVRRGGCVVDVKSALPRDPIEAAGLRLWRL